MMTAKELQSRGGKARWEGISKKDRSKIMSKVSKERNKKYGNKTENTERV